MGDVNENAMRDRAATVSQLGERLGFALVGIAPAEPTAHAPELAEWLADGKHGEMGYLANYQEKREDPRVLLPGAQSVICVADLYFENDGDADAAPSNIQANARSNEQGDSPRGRVARYAWGSDYHKVIKRRLFEFTDAMRDAWPDADYKVTVDTAPVLEREHASRAGLGWVGKHTLLIHPKVGSWLLLGEIITTLAIEPSSIASSIGGFVEPLVEPTDHCGTCTRCIDACPTDCITPYSLDAQRCISYLTIEHRGLIDETMQPLMGHWVAGCDICQEVCPHNGAASGPERAEARSNDGARDQQLIHPSYAPRTHASGFDLLAILNWNAEDRQRALQGSALKRIKLDMFKRNALIAAGNFLATGKVEASAKQDALRQRIGELAEDADVSELVRVTAKQVLKRLN